MDAYETLITPEKVAQMLGVSVSSLRGWRSSFTAENYPKRYLPCIPDPSHKARVLYRLDDVEAFAARNPRYEDRLRANLMRDRKLFNQMIEKAINAA